MQMHARSQMGIGAPDRFLLSPTTCWPFLELGDLGLLLKTQKTCWHLGPHSHLEPIHWCWRAPSPRYQGLPRPLHRVLALPALPALFPMEQALQPCCHALPRSWRQATSFGSWDQEHSGYFPGRPTGGVGTFFLHLSKSLQVELREIKHQASPAAGRFGFWASPAVMDTDRHGRGVSSFLTQPLAVNQCLLHQQLSVNQGLAMPWFIQLPE